MIVVRSNAESIKIGIFALMWQMYATFNDLKCSRGISLESMIDTIDAAPAKQVVNTLLDDFVAGEDAVVLACDTDGRGMVIVKNNNSYGAHLSPIIDQMNSMLKRVVQEANAPHCFCAEIVRPKESIPPLLTYNEDVQYGILAGPDFVAVDILALQQMLINNNLGSLPQQLQDMLSEFLEADYGLYILDNRSGVLVMGMVTHTSSGIRCLVEEGAKIERANFGMQILPLLMKGYSFMSIALHENMKDGSSWPRE